MRSIPLVDGTVVEGQIKSFTDDDAIIVVHANGVRRIELTSVEEPVRSEIRHEHAEQLAEAAREAAEVIDEAAGLLVEGMSETLSEKIDENLAPRGDEWMLWGGIVVAIAAVVLMFIASFAESPVWGIAFFLTSGLCWIPFFFLCFKKAWFPTLVGLVGCAGIVGFILGRAAP